MTIPQAFDLALEHHRAGRLAEAEALYRQILAVQPNHFDSLHLLGVLAHQFGRNDLAVEWIRRALVFNANYAPAYYNLGNALRDQWQPEEAVAAFRRALELQPHFPDAGNNLGNVLRCQGRFQEAEAAFRRALALDPNHAEAHLGLGGVLQDCAQPDEAAASIRRAIELRPGLSGAYNNLGNVLKDQGRLDEAMAAYRQALQLEPSALAVRSNAIHTPLFHPDQDRAAIVKERKQWSQHARISLPRVTLPLENARDPARRLRIGYVSPEFRENVVGRNVLPLFKHHDTEKFELLCYSGTLRTDGITEEFRKHAKVWRHTAGLADEAMVEMIRHDRVDILVDLTQHLAGNRLAVFLRQPVPLQVSFAGYPDTTGLPEIGYRISDRWMEKCGTLETGTELVFFLDSFWCYDPCGVEMEVNGLPASAGRIVTFGCLNNFCKVNERMLKVWARVLRKVEDSRLVLLAGFGSHRQRTLDFLGREGIEAPRVEFFEPRPRQAYLALYHRLDMILDTFPYNGHSTSLDALWMGVPVVTLAGQSAVARAGLSQLSNLGLPELITWTEDEFVETATRLAGDLPRIAELRRSLRARMEASVLMDAPRFARNIEAAYRAMWRRWCIEEAATS